MYGAKRAKKGLTEDTIQDESVEKDTKRKSRNLSEKKRRDQFNLLVNELSSMVSSSGRKMDKSTVLKSSISFLKNHNEVAVRSRIHEIQEDWKPSFLTNEEFSHLVLEAVHGFIIVFEISGQILYASESIMSLLGYLPSEVLTTNFFKIVIEDEQNSLYNSLSNLSSQDNGELSYMCHLKCGESSDYLELVNFAGYFRSINKSQDSKQLESQDSRVFVGTGTLRTPQLIRDVYIIDNKSEFTSRHSLEWKFLFLDHRAPPIIGYLPFELLGTSGYDYYHIDDLDNVANCHEALMQKSEGISCYYRFLTKGQQWIWLQTRFFITYHQWNSKPEFVVCSHRVVGYWDVVKQNKFNTPKHSSNERTDIPWPVETSQHSAESVCSVEAQRSTHSKVSENAYCAETPCQEAADPTQALVHSGEISSDHMLLQSDLQRKQAELQASIGQQQAELMVVSEQLLMAKLGLLSAQTQDTPLQPMFTLNTAAEVSSTTLLPSMQGDLLTPLMAVPSSDLFEVPDSNKTLTDLE